MHVQLLSLADERPPMKKRSPPHLEGKKGKGRLAWVTFYPNNSMAGGKFGTVWDTEWEAYCACGSDGVIMAGLMYKIVPKSTPKTPTPGRKAA